MVSKDIHIQRNLDIESIDDHYGFEKKPEQINVRLPKEEKEGLESILKNILPKEEGSWGLNR